MGWLGKMVGGTIGFALAGPLGAIAGATFGHAFDTSAKYDEGYLADGIIALKHQEIGEADMQRRIRAVKLRSTNHKAGYFSLLYSDGMFRATNVISQ